MDLVHKDKIQTGLVLRGIDLRDQTKMGLVQMDQTKMDRVLRDQTMVRVLRGQIMDRVQIMVRALRGIDHKGQIQTGLVQIMMLDQKMETTHKKKDLETSRSFFLSNCHLL
jgi:hypothetical protein